MLPDYDLILGMDAIETLGGDLRVRNGEATFPSLSSVKENGKRNHEEACAIAEDLRIEDKDFTASFVDSRWIASWKWTGEEPKLSHRVAQYSVSAEAEQEFNDEVSDWIRNG